MKFTFEADMVRGQCYRCPLWQEDYDEDGGWTEYCKLEHSVDAYDEDTDDCPLKEANEIVWHRFPRELPTEDEVYLLTCDFDACIGVTFGKWWADEFVDLETDGKVLAWAELPRSYRGNE